MDSNTNRWLSLCVVLLLAVSTSGCAFLSEKFERFRADDGTATPPTVTDATESVLADGQTDSTIAGVPAVPAQSDQAGATDQAATTEPAVPMTAGAGQTAPAANAQETVSVTGLNIDRPEDVIEMQRRLKLLGFNPGPVDGVAGPQTLLALARFRDMAGPLGNPGLRTIIDEVVSANDVEDSDVKWWKRRVNRTASNTKVAPATNNPWPSDKTISAQTSVGSAEVSAIPPTVGMATTQLDQTQKPAATQIESAKASAESGWESAALENKPLDNAGTSASVEAIDLSGLPKHAQARTPPVSDADASAPTLGERIKSAWRVTRDKVKQGASKTRGGDQSSLENTTADSSMPPAATGN
jgi:hypothetical protein